jgi:hypothetical protein
MYSYSGDSGFRPSNREEWNCIERHLYFDAEKWTMEKIYDTIKILYRKYESFGHTWTLDDVMDHIDGAMFPFINETDGVYIDKKYFLESIKEEKQIDPKEHEIISWELNDKIYNYDYRK